MFVLPLGCIAAAQSNKPHRIGYLGIVKCSSADGSVSTGIARAWLRGGEKPDYRLPMGGWEYGPAS